MGPIVVFVDEIDSIGRRGSSDRHDYWYGPVINAWLAFLDGAEPREGVVVIAATNWPDRVDPALLRPGRLDRHVVIPAPSVEDLEGIVAHHLGVPRDDPGLRAAARAVRGKSPADVEQVARDARRQARRLGRAATCGDLLKALPPPRTTAGEEHAVSVHEAGHAVVGLALGERLVGVDLDGMTTQFRVEGLLLEERLRAAFVVTLAGRAAERVLLRGGTTGCTDDLRKVTLGMRELLFQGGVAGPRWTDHRDYLTKAQEAQLDEALSALEREADALVAARRTFVLRLAAALRERRYLDGDEVLAVERSDRLAALFWRSADRDWERQQVAQQVMMEAEPAWWRAA